MTAPNHLKRLAWLLACVLTGLAVAALGESLSGDQAWYAAIPAAVIAGWMFVANPTECEPMSQKPKQGKAP